MEAAEPSRDGGAIPAGERQGRRPRGDRRLWVLLVEDDAALARAVGRGLRARGFRVTWVGTMAQARVALASAAVDAVLFDVHLPDGHGHELLAAPLLPGHPRPRFVATSGEASPTEIAQLHRLGALAFHPKPILLDDVESDLRGDDAPPPSD